MCCNLPVCQKEADLDRVPFGDAARSISLELPIIMMVMMMMMMMVGGGGDDGWWW